MTGGALDYLSSRSGLLSEPAATVVSAYRSVIAVIALDKFEKAVFEEDGFVLIHPQDLAH
jgi:hypothetical protein